jgi:hypothetical protein
MSCAVLTNAPKTKGRLERSQYADVIYQNKVQSKIIMKYTEDDKPLWNTIWCHQRQWGFYYIMTKKPLNTPLPMWD